LDENPGWLSSLGDSVFRYVKKFIVFATIMSVLFPTAAEARPAHVVKKAVSPHLKATTHFHRLRVQPSPLPAKSHRLSKAAIVKVLRAAGFKGAALRTAYGVAMKESHANPVDHNYNPKTGDDSYGVFQINLYGSLKARTETYGLKSANDLKDPLTNAKVAYEMSHGGKNWSPWKAEPGQRDYAITKTYKAQFDKKN
jgi:Lysozyme like domain